MTAGVHLYRKEEPTAQERVEQCIALCTEYEFAGDLAMSTTVRGEALARQGHVEEGITLMGQGLTANRAIGAELRRSYFLSLIAEAYGEVGRAEEGLSLLAKALTHVDKTGERYYEAEVYRVKGELVLQSGVRSPESEAEECFHKAIDIARQQRAKSWELRAVMSLSRLWQQQGKTKQAHKKLAETYNWFTEGFDTVDLQEAKALLEELA